MNYSQCFCCWDEADGHSILLFFSCPLLFSSACLCFSNDLWIFPCDVLVFGKKPMKNLQWIFPFSLWCCGIILLNFLGKNEWRISNEFVLFPCDVVVYYCWIFWEKINEESPMNSSYFLVMLWYNIVEFWKMQWRIYRHVHKLFADGSLFSLSVLSR